MKYFLWLLRIVIGVLFIFSGVVKANDPMGLVYKMDEFFEALNMTFMMQWAFVFSIVMIALEIISGVAVLIGYRFRFFSGLLVLLNILFTFITAFALFTGKVKECGCFGACIKISSEATFEKDVILLVISVILWVYRKRITPLLPAAIGTTVMTATAAFGFGLQWYVIVHLPINDCLAYKPGANLWQELQPAPDAQAPIYKTTFVYKNVKTGEQRQFTTENLPWQDSLTWKYVSSDTKLLKEGTGQPLIPHDFQFNDSDNNDRTQDILTAKGYTFLWFIREPEKAHLKNMDRLHSIINSAAAAHIPFYVLCSVGYDDALPFRKQWDLLGTPMLTLDGTVSKTALRTNPGLMLLKDGVVVKKWSYLDYPSITVNNGTVEYK